MAHPFEVSGEIEIEATPEEVWEALTTGPGMDAWFMGANEVEPRLGGAVRTTVAGWTLESSVTVWDPPHRFVNTSPEDADGRLMAFEYVIEGRGGTTTLLRYVHSGFLPGDDWEQEYEALKTGDPAYLFKLGEYLRYFRGRTATPISAIGPQVDRERAWAVFRDALGLTTEIAIGAPVHFEAPGLAPLKGVVDYVSSDFLGVRTDDGMYRFIHGLGGAVVLGHHVFAEVDGPAVERAWQDWLDRTFA